MNLKIIAVILLIMFLTPKLMFAQKGDTLGLLRGRVVDQQKKPLYYVTIELINQSDNSKRGTVSLSHGLYSVDKLLPGRYLLNIRYLGFKPVAKHFSITTLKNIVRLEDIIMEPQEYTLNTVEIKSKNISPVTVRKDTMEYTSAAYHSRENDLLEDLLKRLPGIEVNRLGQVKAQGEAVTRVLLNGKEFFTGDPSLAFKNIPAGIINKIQVFDQSTDQSAFSGINFGQKSKTINVVTSDDQKDGYFIKQSVGYGDQHRYDANGSVNIFKHEMQISLIDRISNVSDQISSAPGGQIAPGRTSSKIAGVNFSTQTKNATQINFSYNLDQNLTTINQRSDTRTIYNDFTQINTNTSKMANQMVGHRFNFLFDTKLSSSISLKIQPALTLAKFDNSNISDYSNISSSSTVNGSQQLSSTGTSPLLTNTVLLSKKFKKLGRTLSLNLSSSIGTDHNRSLNLREETPAVPSNTSSLDLNQTIINTGNQKNNIATLFYSEPINSRNIIGFKVVESIDVNNINRQALDFGHISKQYDSLNTVLTNRFTNKVFKHIAGLTYAYNGLKLNLVTGIDVQAFNQQNDIVNKRFLNILPLAEMIFKFTDRKRISLRYNGRTNQPDISQIQPVIDNLSNSSTLYGNTNLKPSFTNNFSASFNNYITNRNQIIFINANTSITGASIVPSVYFDTISHKNVIQFINSNKSVATVLNGLYGFALLPKNILNLNIGLTGSLNRMNNLTNAQNNITTAIGLNNNYRLNGQLNKIDFIFSASVNYNLTTFSIQSANDQKYMLYQTGLDLSYLFSNNIRVSVNANFNKATGRGEGFDLTTLPINASVSKQFFKNKAGILKLFVNDIFKENVGINRTSNGISITDNNYNILNRYFILSFSYSISKIGAHSPK